MSSDDLTLAYCPVCQQKIGEVVHAESSTRQGWYCFTDKVWVKAIGRERVLEDMSFSEQHNAGIRQ